MKHLGDITKINGKTAEPVEVIIGGSPCQDLSVAGKRAGLGGARSGLFMEQIRIIKEMRENDKRAGRTGELCRPRFMVWENVLGSYSSNGGEDFRTVLEETAKIADPEVSIPRPPRDKWTNAGCIMGRGYSIAWRTLDAQYFGVPQRRRRIALVADFGGTSAPEVLFKQDCLPRNFEPGRTERETAPSDAERGADTAISFQERAGCAGGAKEYSSSTIEQEHSQPLTISECVPQSKVYGISAYESNSMKSDNPHSGIYEADTTRTLDNNGGNPACNQGGMIVLEGNGSRPSHLGDGYAESDVMYTLNATEQHAVYSIETKQQSLASEDGKAGTIGANDYKEPQAICYVTDQGAGKSSVSISEGVSPTHATTHDGAPAVFSIENHPNDSRCRIDPNGKVQSLSSRMGTGGNNTPMALMIGNGQADQTGLHDLAGALNCMHDQQAVMTYGLDRAAYNQGKNAKYNFSVEKEKIGAQTAKGPGAVCQSVVRRLTPLECTRLQGYPDGWVDIGDWTDSKGKKHKDADSPKYKALGNSIAVCCWRFILRNINEYCTEHTMASLFSGIGGFELCSLQVGMKPVWNSEVEEFCIAVTKKHFGNGDEKGDYEQYL